MHDDGLCRLVSRKLRDKHVRFSGIIESVISTADYRADYSDRCYDTKLFTIHFDCGADVLEVGRLLGCAVDECRTARQQQATQYGD
jgi:hypothetical protein